MRNKITLIVALLLFAALFSAFDRPAQAQTVPPQETPRTLNVTGTGRAYLSPDVAYIAIGVHTEDKDAAEAVAANNTRSQKVADALKTFKVDAKDIQTMNFSIFPQQQYDQAGQLTGLIYVVDNTVYVTLRDLDKVGEIISAAVEAGANSINSIQFDVEDKSAALNEARKNAVADAVAQAKVLSQAAGVELGQIQTISSYGSGYPVPLYDAKAYGVGGGSPTPVSPGQLVLSVDVNIVYALK
ncbi:MAG: SIMPL domain-containing protein [Chloroflexi bacterium]|nr:SIMPL domain-containing protein [Chloroflexota bacterium]